MTILALVRLDGGLVVEHGRDDIAVDRIRLTADNDPVTIADRRVDHGFANDLEQEQFAIANDGTGERKDLLNGLLGKDGAAGCNATNDRNIGCCWPFISGAGRVKCVLTNDGRLAWQYDFHGAR